MKPYSLCLAVGYRANIARQLGVPNVSLHNYEGMFEPTDRKIANSGMHFFLLNTLMGGLEKRSAKKFKLEIAQRIASKHVISVRNKAAKEAKELCESGQCASALPLLQKAIDFGDLPSRALMAWMLLDGREGVAQDRNRAFELVEEGARLGCHHCQGVMAKCYMYGYGFGILRNEAQSLELARKSSGSGLGSRYGQNVLGRLYHLGVGGVAQDYAQALALYRLAAAQNLDEAQFNLGLIYYYGSYVAQDYTEALRWYQLAAAQGHPWALFMVAECHDYGLGVRINKAEAIRWYMRAHAAGHPYAAAKLQKCRA
jgi:TPR repeat protein